MHQLLPLIASFASKDLGAVFARARRNALVYAIAAVLVLTAYVAALIGGGIYLAQAVGAVQAAFLIAAGTLVLAAVALGSVVVFNRIARRRRARARRNTGPEALISAAALALLPRVLNSKALVPVAVLGGLAVLMTRGRSDGSGD